MAQNITLWKITARSFGGLRCLKLRGLSITKTQSPCQSLLLLESTAIKWLKYWTNKAISCFHGWFHSQRLITKPLPSTQNGRCLEHGSCLHESAAPLGSLHFVLHIHHCKTAQSEHCTSTVYWLQTLHLPPIMGWEETTAWSRCSQTSVTWNVIATYSCQADSCWNLVWNIFSVDMTNSRARDVLHATSTHPYLWNSRDTGSLLVIWRKMKKKKAKERLSSHEKA